MKYDGLFVSCILMMDQFNFDSCPDRAHTDSVKYDRYADSGILPMWVADMDFAVAAEITDAISARLQHPIYGYSHVPERLNALVVERMQRLYQWPVKAEWLVWVPGVVASVNIACRSIQHTAAGVLCPSVVYPYIPEAPVLSGHHLVEVPMVQKNQRWLMDLDWIHTLPAGNQKMLILCNPHNPGGSVYSRDELAELAESVLQKDMIIVSDEVHCELLLEQSVRHIPIASLDNNIEQRSITLMAASKTFNLAGLGCSFAIIPNRQLRDNFRQASKGIISHVNLFGYIATQAAYERCENWHRQLIDYLRANRDYLVEQINNIPGLLLGPVEATYLAWIDVSELGLDDPHRFFEQAGVGMSPGRDFGDNGFMRLNFGCSRATLHEAVSRIRTAVNQHWKQKNV